MANRVGCKLVFMVRGIWWLWYAQHFELIFGQVDDEHLLAAEFTRFSRCDFCRRSRVVADIFGARGIVRQSSEMVHIFTAPKRFRIVSDSYVTIIVGVFARPVSCSAPS